MPDVSGARLAVPSTLHDVGTDLNGYAMMIQGELEDLKTALDAVDAYWTGTARDWYEGLRHEWDIAAEGLFCPTGVLGVIAQTMNLNWNNYTNCELSNRRTWKH